MKLVLDTGESIELTRLSVSDTSDQPGVWTGTSKNGIVYWIEDIGQTTDQWILQQEAHQ